MHYKFLGLLSIFLLILGCGASPEERMSECEDTVKKSQEIISLAFMGRPGIRDTVQLRKAIVEKINQIPRRFRKGVNPEAQDLEEILKIISKNLESDPYCEKIVRRLRY